MLKLESALAVFSVAQRVADNLITIMLCAMEAGSTVGREVLPISTTKVLMPLTQFVNLDQPLKSLLK